LNHPVYIIYIFVYNIYICILHNMLCYVNIQKKNSDKQINKLIIPNYSIKWLFSYTHYYCLYCLSNCYLRSIRQFLSRNIDVSHGSVLGIIIYHGKVQLDKFAANTLQACTVNYYRYDRIGRYKCITYYEDEPRWFL